uniref:Uncharacterized protein n=1 Tax=Romanomermis culicivorax TaxID=13658 RepID=A0A915L8Y9_ROMCU
MEAPPIPYTSTALGSSPQPNPGTVGVAADQTIFIFYFVKFGPSADIYVLCNLLVVSKLKKKMYLKQMTRVLTMTILNWLMMKQELPISVQLFKT